jgi:hypothetical protein
MRQADLFMHEIDGFDIAMKERHPRNSLRIGLTILVISRSLAATSFSIGEKRKKLSQCRALLNQDMALGCLFLANPVLPFIAQLHA